ncbi:transposase [uncultured Oscillibacter sp.]|uniref:transposase n=1 Tax=uncultured Oscillibacter sp. TaxID=876091 RepID=UPI00345D4310
MLFKLVLLQHLDGNVSLRGTLRRAKTDAAYRWFLRYTLSEEPGVWAVSQRRA